MRIKIYYTVVQVSLPEWETGELTDLESYNDVNEALDKRNEKNEYNENENFWYEVTVHEITAD